MTTLRTAHGPAETTPADPADEVLSIDGLTTSIRTGQGDRRQGEQRLIEDIGFSVRRGQTLGIVGESGSGKSVTALSIMRLLPRSATVAGRVMLKGRNLTTLSDRQMADVRGDRIGMIFQEPMTSLNPVLPVGLQIEESLRRHKVASGQAARRRAVELLDRVRIPNAARRTAEYPHQLSGGMRQRVMIAMALACNPELLIADEPTTALDVTTQAGIIDLLKQIQADDGTAIMFITHDMGVVAEVSDDVLVMRSGRIVEHGPSQQIFHRPAETYTRQLLNSVPRIGDMRGKPGPAPFASIGDDGAALAPSPLEVAKGPVLRVTDLSVSFRVRNETSRFRRTTLRAVRGVGFDLRAGETLAIVGESGCGKSTLARSIMGLQAVDSGAIEVAGRVATSMTAAEARLARKAIQMVFQDPFASLNPRLRIVDSLTEPLTAHGVSSGGARATAVRLIEEVGLSAEMLDRLPHQFSGGQRQRICIARALALEPEVIVADEAVSALDVSVQAQVLNLLMQLQARRGLALLFISHDMAVVERLSHRVAVMYRGQIVEIGPRAAVFERPAHAYTRRLLSAVPLPDPSRRHKLSGIEELFGTPSAEPSTAAWTDLGDGHRVLAA
ncbi:ABC transporter ATP-binding protein [Acuticoccus mangrovi]|uniref:ABC transporter ATP-binding protein n=1 Tax=Acuticoccus mangrovi TaxID=2796142 RepID=A0A934IMC4_9HYPH|nr:ABC transporter ATP-binding protein [Acuticoccus mangrovi]MBJ3776477.1 ABC transporter ATP-binding protein [Acuticoccus mangrovi]